MPLSTDYKRALLRTLYDECSDTGLTLTQAISALRKARVQSTNTGAVIVATAANGHSVQFETARCTPQEIASFASYLEDIYTDASTALTTAGTAITDANLLTQMLTIIGRPIRAVRPDFSLYGITSTDG